MAYPDVLDQARRDTVCLAIYEQDSTRPLSGDELIFLK